MINHPFPQDDPYFDHLEVDVNIDKCSMVSSNLMDSLMAKTLHKGLGSLSQVQVLLCYAQISSRI